MQFYLFINLWGDQKKQIETEALTKHKKRSLQDWNWIEIDISGHQASS